MIGIAECISLPVKPATQELLDRCLDAPWVADICAKIRDARERHLAGQSTREEYHAEKSLLKKGLPIITPHATFGPTGRRANDEAVPTGLFMMDYDDVSNPEALFHEHIEPLIDPWGIVVAAQTPGGGLRVIATIPRAFRETMTPELAITASQMSFADACGLHNYDKSCKDLARCSFLVPREYIYYIDMPKLLAPAEPWPELVIPYGYAEHVDWPEADEPETSTVGVDRGEIEKGKMKIENHPDGPRLVGPGEAPETPGETGEDVGENPETPGLPTTFRGLKYKDIIAEWFRQTGGEPQMGERNSRLHQLACNLRGITDNDAQLIYSILPDYGLSARERKCLILSALKGEHYGISASMKRVLQKLQNPGEIEKGKLKIEKPDAPDTPDGPDKDNAVPEPPAMPTRLPRLIELLLRPIPDVYRPAVAHAIFPSLATHLWKTYFRYVDNVFHECTLMNVLLAETGAGKDCINMPINLIMEDIRKRDRENLRRESEWKQEMATKSANVDKSARPPGLVIQEIDPDVTNAAFVMRLHEADDHFLYTRMNEIDQFDALKGNGRAGQQFQIMCLAFDPQNQYGQTRVGWNSVTEKVQVRFNWNASSTINHGRAYFRRVAINGPLSRINFCTIPTRPIGSDIPIYGEYSLEDKALIAKYIDTLNRTTGIITDPRLTDLARQLLRHCQMESILSQDRVYENLSFRACVIAWLKICLLYVAGGLEWEDTFADFARWSLDYDLYCKMLFFGEMITNAQAQADSLTKHTQRNLLALLPDVFTREQAMAVRKLQGKPEGPRFMLSTWKRRGLIIQNDDGTYRKTTN